MSKLLKRYQVATAAAIAPLPEWPGRIVPRGHVQLADPVVVAPPALQPETAPPLALAPAPTEQTTVPPAPSRARQAELRAEANRIVASAQSRAEFIIDEALAGAEKLAVEAKATGFKTGRAEGLAAAEKEIAELRLQLEEERAQLMAERQEGQAELARLRAEAEMAAHRLRSEAEESAEQLVTASQQQVIDLALAVASRIMQRELERDPEALIGILAGALQRVRGAGAVTVKVSPAGIAALSDVEDELDRVELGIETLTVVADPALNLGDVVLDTGHGTVDARLNEQLAGMRRSLGEVVGHDDH